MNNNTTPLGLDTALLGITEADIQPRIAQTEYLINLAENIPEPRYTIKMNGVGFGPLGDIVAVKGKAKVGKSYFLSILASVLLGKSFGELETAIDNATVVYLDTEQNRANSARLARRVHTLLGWPTNQNNPRFKVFSLRRMPMEERQDFIQGVIEDVRPQVVFLDGVVDLLNNFNDLEESTMIVEWLMKTSADYDCLIITVLHENKSKEDNNMRGHLGTALVNKCADVFQLTKTNGYFKVEQTETRNAPVDEIDFSLDGNGMPFPAQSMQDRKVDEKRAQIREVLQEIFQDGRYLKYSELCKEYSVHGVCSLPTAKRKISAGKSYGLIEVVDGSDKYKLVSSIS